MSLHKVAINVTLKIFSLFIFSTPGSLTTVAGVLYMNDQNVTM